MSRIRILGASMVALAASIGAASSADAPVYTPDPVYAPVSAYNWSGAYVGLSGGYNWGTAKVGAAPANVSTGGLSGGLYAGYNFLQSGSFVLGVEGDVYISGQSGTLGGTKYSNPWGGSLRARAGVAIDRFLVYGTGGVAIGSVKAATPGASDSALKAGWTLGAGIEAAVTNNVTARVEYRYTDLGTATLAPGGNVNLNSSALMIGVGMKF